MIVGIISSQIIAYLAVDRKKADRPDCEYRWRLRERQRRGAIDFHRAVGAASKAASILYMKVLPISTVNASLPAMSHEYGIQAGSFCHDLLEIAGQICYA